MRGHEALIAMRRRRIRPRMALVDLVPAYTRNSADWQTRTSLPHIEVDDRETVGRLDLRCLLGMIVCCSGFDSDRLDALHTACVDAGAARVFSSLYAEREEGELQTLRYRASWAEQGSAHG